MIGVTRRDAMGQALGAAMAVLAGRAATAASAEGVRPNFLCLVSEDCAASYLGVYGGQAVTPNLDRLAKEGVLFRTAISCAPVCAPSRFALITGVAPESCGPAEHMRTPSGDLPDGLRERGWPALLRDAGYYATNNSKEDYNAPIDVDATWDESSPQAHWRNRPAGAPFFAVFNPMTTHESQVFTASLVDDLTAGNGSSPIPPVDQIIVGGLTTVGGPTRPADVRLPPYSPDTPTTRRDAAKYHNLVHAMDKQMGARLAELEKSGVADDTIVLLYSDHAGVLLRSKRFLYDSGTRVPLIVRFGKNVRHLAPDAPGSQVAAPVSTGLDIPVTVLTSAGLAPGPHMCGKAFAGPRRAVRRYAYSISNRQDERYDMVRAVRDERYRYVRNYLPHLPLGQHIMFAWLQAGYREFEQRHIDGKLTPLQEGFWQSRPFEELYDLHTDPHEVHDLANDPAHDATLVRLRCALDKHMLAINDNGFIPEGSPLEGFERSRGPGRYPLKKVMRLAAAAAQRDPGYLPVLVRLLAHENEVVRYWAAQGCCMLDRDATPARVTLQSAVDADPSVHVRIVAAEALGRIGVGAAPVEFLGRTLVDHPNQKVRLQAACALENLGEAARPALPYLLIAQAKLDVGEGPTALLEQYPAQAARHTALKLSGAYVPLP